MCSMYLLCNLSLNSTHGTPRLEIMLSYGGNVSSPILWMNKWEWKDEI